MTAARKRFIAGAVCPRCRMMDTLAVSQDQDISVVTCVRCGYQQRQPDDQEANRADGAADRIIGIFQPD
ncbi:YheV family putative metal-binding protein [Affinibrenneria salicis]|uniref:YheV family putative metal-binding protein n=1 Tax=Affinibrenneria salicis TaxID=2590031 RepID=A0A5J5FSK0_9GAMM|nr:YheV family putative zinc ribbon protein [Affinibrenneria salicis]KAA8996352.1 YheV family putative metal-binding protein [Affinibrenneria salicis]